LWKPQRFVQVRIVKNVPEMIGDLAISPKLIRKHKLDRSQHECEKCVVDAAMRFLPQANGRDCVIARRPRHQEDCA